MASFDIAYTRFVKPIEGGYANIAADKGGETYAGIARKYWPKWSGWPYIDSVKASNGGKIKWNTKFPQLDSAVTAFYKVMWDKNYFGYIQSQDVANILFDWYVNSGGSAFDTRPEETYGIQEILNKWFGKNISADGAMGMQTVNAINSVDSAKLNNIIIEQRKVFYDYLVKHNSSQSTFYKGWLDRLSKFPTLKAAGVSIGIIAVIAIGIYFAFSQGKQKKQISAVSKSVAVGLPFFAAALQLFFSYNAVIG
jgi:lysozyme family protein